MYEDARSLLYCIYKKLMTTQTDLPYPREKALLADLSFSSTDLPHRKSPWRCKDSHVLKIINVAKNQLELMIMCICIYNDHVQIKYCAIFRTKQNLKNLQMTPCRSQYLDDATELKQRPASTISKLVRITLELSYH